MNPLKPIALLIFLCICSSVQAQEDSVFKFRKKIAGNFSWFTIDNLDNVYLINESDRLKKLGPKGDSVAVFNDVKRYGKLWSVDVSNPLRLLLYYRNFSTLVFLDRLLNIRNSIDLRKQGILSVKAVANSYDNNIWLFDEQEVKLKKIDEQGKLLLESVDCRQLFDSVPSPEQIIDCDGYVYLYDPQKGFYVFDYYGAYKNRLHFTGWQNVDASGNNIYGFSENKFFSYRINSLNLREYNLPKFFSDYSSIKAKNNTVYLLKEKGVEVYDIK